ncbi:ubiquinol-cytochrome-c reductase complex assembly factor 2-like [Pollicipes pollicipes]|uniref:ubiquinol-cytochrome-c reductase complex assembly factor 2-like n=1 Tax=Pollicipes pollicipes TaxID=41117 RepID=UPI001885739A|nr:ubiquinol-cytochrome-c reductase complex assembly factor 2-like [Pollicipes pollicipes]XP_037082795.1 ubiquinol-cytochrome-c reductase complex assembly factor 2-like [Pollicipes pollicipes]
MGSSAYRGFLRLLEKWPADHTKSGRDLGEYIRVCVADAFRHEERSSVDEKACRRQLESLSRIANNHHLHSARRSGTGTGSGLSVDQCHQLMTNEFLQQLETLDQGWMKRISLSVGARK